MSVVPEGMQIPDGMQLPDGMPLPDGVQLPDGFELPPGFEIPAGVNLTAELLAQAAALGQGLGGNQAGGIGQHLPGIIYSQTLLEIFAAIKYRSDLFSLRDFITLTEAGLPFRFLIVCLGIVTNSLCIKTYYKIGLENSVTLLFFVLAIFDWFHLVNVIPVMIKDILDVIIREDIIWIETFPIFLIVITIVPRIFVESACQITTFLAVQRCMCVIYPLHFKEFFTRKRMYAVLIVIFLFCFILHMAQILQHEVIKVPLQTGNQSRTLTFFVPISLTLDDALFVLFGVVINVSTQVILMLCVIIMARALKKSVKFRTASSVTSKNQDGDAEKGGAVQQKGGSSSSASVLSNTKELQAITQVALVCTIYLVCNIPRCINSFCVMFIPAMDVYMPDNFVFLYFNNIVQTFEDLNASINFFVYYKYNKKFREALFGDTSKK